MAGSNENLLHIIPDRQLLPNVGESGYYFSEAISELVDNSIDAFYKFSGNNQILPEAEIQISFKSNGTTIVIEDNASGMSKDELESALRLAHVSKKKRKLGQYGMGLKSACTALGNSFKIETTSVGSDKIYTVNYVESDWLNGKDDEWTIPVVSSDTSLSTHFTKITISALKMELYSYRTSQLLSHLSRRYSAYLKLPKKDGLSSKKNESSFPYVTRKDDSGVIIKVNSKRVDPLEYREVAFDSFPASDIPYNVIEMIKGESQLLGSNGVIQLSNGKEIRGWVGLLLKSSQRGFYGINLFRQGRLISEHNKDLLRSKISFESEENYDISAGHPSLARVFGEIHIDFAPATINKRQFDFESEEWKEAATAIVNDENFRKVISRSRELAQSKSKKLSPEKERKLKSVFNFLITYLKDNGSLANVIFEEPEVSHLDSPAMYTVQSHRGKVTVITNSSFPAYSLSKDQVFYNTFVFAEALSEMQTENNNFIQFIKNRNDLLSVSAKYIRKAETSKKKLV